MKPKFPIHPLIFALYPLLAVLINNTGARHLAGPLGKAALLALGGAALYGVLWLALRNAGRAALLASLGILLFHAYDPAYELLRGREVLGMIIGKHRYLLPLWIGLLAFGAGFLFRRFRRVAPLNTVFNAGSLVLLVPSLILMAVTGSWLTALRDIGLAPPPGLEVSYINVGDAGDGTQGVIGDAILLRSTEGKTMLIDAGYPNGLAAAFLREQGVDHLDVVVMTHPHDDHVGGLVEILKTIPVDLVVSNGEPLDESPVYREIQQIIHDSAIPTRIVRTGHEIPFGYLTFQVLSPVELSPHSVNNNSVVLRLVVGKVSFLFTGDSDAVEQARLLQTSANIQATIYKISHHGAFGNTDPAFIAKMKPEVAIYIAGTDNAYGFPEAPTLKIFADQGIPVYGTDKNGSIIVRTDGKTYEVVPEREASE